MKRLLIPCLLLILPPLLIAQQPYAPEALTAADYEKGENSLYRHVNALVYNVNIRPEWVDEHRFWYRRSTEAGHEFMLVNAVERAKQPAFDHKKLAAQLSKALARSIDPYALPFNSISIREEGAIIAFTIQGTAFRYVKAEDQLINEGQDGHPGPEYSLSPDGKRAVFIRDHNLWVKNMDSGQEKALTTDGIPDFGYGTNNAGWIRSKRPVLLWSHDSKKIATFQHDSRGVGEMHLVTTNVGHPKLESWKYPLPEDSVIFRIHRLIIDIDSEEVVRLKMGPDPHRSSTSDHIADWDGTLLDAQWSADGQHLAFLSNSRDHKEAQLRIADAATGEVRTVLEERVETFFEAGYNAANWRVLKATDQVIWYSQRSNWGHLYRYDFTSGKLSHSITTGAWNVLQVRGIDEKAGMIYFTGAGREPGDPYFQYFYRVDMRGNEPPELLTPDSANHNIYLSPEADYFVDHYSTPSTAPKTVLRDKNGNKLLDLEEADISALLATGWQPPISFSVKARDGETDLYGLLYKPVDFDSTRKYPIINKIYPGPQTGSVGSRNFYPARGDEQAIANLGFIVVKIDAMGTPMRSKSFHDAYYGNMGDNGLSDQVTGMQQLAERHSWIDLDRAGIYGHSGGGFASTGAILRYPDFFKVAVSSAGNHDNRNYEDDWGEKWQGLLRTNPDGTTSYDNQANQLLAKNLKGKLLIAHGTMDDNVPYYNTMLVVDALIEANKDFDLIMMPNRRHGFSSEPFFMRKRWDYFVQNLLGAQPPKEYEFYRKLAKP